MPGLPDDTRESTGEGELELEPIEPESPAGEEEKPPAPRSELVERFLRELGGD